MRLADSVADVYPDAIRLAVIETSLPADTFPHR